MSKCPMCGKEIYGNYQYCYRCNTIQKKFADVTKEWLIACNLDRYRLFDAIKEHKMIYWRAKAGFSVGDIVYLFFVGEKSIPYLCKFDVTAINKSQKDLPYDDKEYYISTIKRSDEPYTFFENPKLFYNDLINLHQFRLHSFSNFTLRSTMLLNKVPELLEFIHDIEKNGNTKISTFNEE